MLDSYSQCNTFRIPVCKFKLPYEYIWNFKNTLKMDKPETLWYVKLFDNLLLKDVGLNWWCGT